MRTLRLSLLTILTFGLVVGLAIAQDEPEVTSIVLSGHQDAVTLLAWSPDGQILASSAGNWDSFDPVVRLWGRDGTLIAALRGTNVPAASLDWSPDGSVLATGLYDATIRLWQSDGTLLNTIEADNGTVFAVDWSPDGTELASASLAGTSDNTVQIWAADGTLLHTLPTQYSGGKFLNVGWSPDGQFLAGGAVDYKEWQADGTVVFTHDSCQFCTPAWGFGWSPDSSMWAIGNESGVVWVYSVEGEELGYLQNSVGNVDVLAWSPDGQILAGGNALWEWTGETFDRHSGIGGGRIWSLSWSPDSTMLAVAEANKNRVGLWDTNGKQLAILTEHTGNVERVAWSPDGDLLASASNDRTVRLWDVSGVSADEVD